MAEIDPTGTAPGVVMKEEPPETINMRCRDPKCDSILAVELKIPGVGNGRHMYQCTKCKHTWGTAVGGAVEW